METELVCFGFYCLTFVIGDSYTTIQPEAIEGNPLVAFFLTKKFGFAFWVCLKLGFGIIFFQYIEFTLLLGFAGFLLTCWNYRVIRDARQQIEDSRQ